MKYMIYKRSRNTKCGRSFPDRQWSKFRYHPFDLNFGRFSFFARFFWFWRYMANWTYFFEVKYNVYYYISSWRIYFVKFTLTGTLDWDYLLELVKLIWISYFILRQYVLYIIKHIKKIIFISSLKWYITWPVLLNVEEVI